MGFVLEEAAYPMPALELTLRKKSLLALLAGWLVVIGGGDNKLEAQFSPFPETTS